MNFTKENYQVYLNSLIVKPFNIRFPDIGATERGIQCVKNLFFEGVLTSIDIIGSQFIRKLETEEKKILLWFENIPYDVYMPTIDFPLDNDIVNFFAKNFWRLDIYNFQFNANQTKLMKIVYDYPPNFKKKQCNYE